MDIEAFPVVTTTIMLVVGRIRDPVALPRIPGFHFRTFDAVNRALLDELQPEVVISALIAHDFDAIELARLLTEAGYRGRYRALSGALPDVRIVVTEVRATVPGIDFDLFVLAKPGHR